MAINLSAHRTALRDAINAVWTEVDRDNGGGGIWTAARLELVALEDLRADDEIATTAIIEQPPFLVAEEHTGIANQVYAAETRFHYVRRRDTTTDMEEFIFAKLVLLEQRLLHIALSVGQVIDVTELDAGEANAMNALLLDKNKAYYGGTLAALIEVGESPA